MNDTNTAEVYAVSVVTVRRWRRSGKEAKLPAPFGQPQLMPDWWESMEAAGHFEKSCPHGVRQAAERVAAALNKDDDTFPAPGEESDELTAFLANLDQREQMTYGDGIKAAARNVQVADWFLTRAIKAGEEKRIGPLHRRFNESSDQLRAFLRDRGKIEAEALETLPKSEVRTALLEIHSNITKQFRNGIKAAFPDIGDLAKSREGWAVFADDLVDRICRKLTETNFAA